jgi:uncharacterized RDD family membrane protein YckC
MTHLPDPVYQSEFYASVPTTRLLAWGIDTIVILVICIIIGLLTVTLAFWVFPLLLLTVSFLYRLLTIASQSATWGMRLMNIEFRRNDGMKFDFATAFLHTLGYIFSVGLPLIQLVSIVFMATSERGQGLTDMVLGTTALNRREQL